MPPHTSYPRRELARLRLAAQGLVPTGESGAADRAWATAGEVARAFGVMQGQDLHSVRRSLALRAVNAQDWTKLVRGYPMRGTLFVGAPEDMGWITQLCARPRPRDPDLRGLAEAMPGPMTRAELKELAARLYPDLAFWHVVRILAENNLVYYTGPDQLLTPMPLPGLEQCFNGDRVAATAELATRYFRTHGPATARDFQWWTKLPQRLIRPALELLPADLERRGEYIAPQGLTPTARTVLLLGAFDEYVLGYQDRLFAMDAATHEALVPGNRGVFRRAVVIDGQVRGAWTAAGVEDRAIPAYAQARVRRAHAQAAGGN